MRRWLPFALWLALVSSIILAADNGWLGWILFYIDRIPFGDKIGHLILIGALAYFLNHALRKFRVPILTRQVLLGGLIVAAAITLEEISQIWIPGRHFDLGDLAANYAGVCIAGFLTAGPKPRREEGLEAAAVLESPETIP